MSRRRRIHGMSTGTTIALVGAGIVAVYLLTKPKTTVPMLPPGYTAYNPGAAQSSAQATTAIANAAGSVANNLINSIFS